MKRQVDARRLAQMMVGIGRRADKHVQALITDMNQPLGYAIGNALEVMEVSQTLQNAGPADLTRLSLELAARMIFLGKLTDDARRSARAGAEEAAGWVGLSQAERSHRGAGRQPAGARPLRATAECHWGARDQFSARGIHQCHRRRIYRPGVVDDRRGPRYQGRLDRSGRWRDPRSEGRAKKWMRAACCAACTTRAKTTSTKPRSWSKMLSAFLLTRRRAAN